MDKQATKHNLHNDQDGLNWNKVKVQPTQWLDGLMGNKVKLTQWQDGLMGNKVKLTQWQDRLTGNKVQLTQWPDELTGNKRYNLHNDQDGLTGNKVQLKQWPDGLTGNKVQLTQWPRWTDRQQGTTYTMTRWTAGEQIWGAKARTIYLKISNCSFLLLFVQFVKILTMFKWLLTSQCIVC